MVEDILDLLKTYNKGTITELELRHALKTFGSIKVYATALHQLESRGILSPIRKANSFVREGEVIANKWRINKGKIYSSLVVERHKLQSKLPQCISLDEYSGLSEEQWIMDVPWIERLAPRVDSLLYQENLSLAEISWRLVEDEKWIEYKNGKALLERLQIMSKLKIAVTPDPVMFGFFASPADIENWKHLIVENKGCWYRLMGLNAATGYHTCIYGAGWKVVAGISFFPKQLGPGEAIKYEKNNKCHEYTYFGDLDHEGISIWYAVHEKVGARPSTSLYRQLLNCPQVTGKETQRCNQEALEAFLSYFTAEECDAIQNLLAHGRYIPQEALDGEVNCEYNE